MVKHLRVQLGNWVPILCQGWRLDADLGRSCTEGRGPAGGLGQQSESLPAKGAAVSVIWPTVCGQFVIF